MEPRLGSLLISIMSVILGFSTFVRLYREPVDIVVDDVSLSDSCTVCSVHGARPFITVLDGVFYIFSGLDLYETRIQTLIKEAKLQTPVRVGVAARLKRRLLPLPTVA